LLAVLAVDLADLVVEDLVEDLAEFFFSVKGFLTGFLGAVFFSEGFLEVVVTFLVVEVVFLATVEAGLTF
jgi:hypothetical protein